jgi:plasmid stabilization system protein ParE
MTIEWTKPAKKDLKKIFSYYKKKSSKEISQKITDGILDYTAILKTQNIGKN